MRTINVNQVIDQGKFSKFHLSIVFWVTVIIIFDGFDLVVFGTIVSSLMEEWGLTPVEAGALNSYGLFGIMIGALALGSLADKLGRKNMILLCVFLFSGFSALCAFSNSPTVFAILRFLAGVGLGGVMPIVTALITDYAPKHLKSTLVTIAYAGYPIGGILTSFFGMLLIPNFGWGSVLLVGALPILLLPFMYLYLPDSPSFYIMRNKQDKLSTILQEINSEYTAKKDDFFEIALPEKKEIPISELPTTY